jgi:hypothetical protein
MIDQTDISLNDGKGSACDNPAQTIISSAGAEVGRS